MSVNEYSSMYMCIWLINKVPPIYVKLLLAVDDDFAPTTLNWSERERENVEARRGAARDCDLE